MKRVTMVRFQCISCKATELVELEHFEEEAKLPLGWCGLKGWWRETPKRTNAATQGTATQGEAMPQMDKLPLDAECCSYECMENFLKGALLRGDAQTRKLVNELTPQATSEEKTC